MTPTPRPVMPGIGVCLLLYGLPAVGKTRLIGSAGKVLIIHPPTDHTDSLNPAAGAEEIIVDDHSGLLDVLQWGQQGGFEKYDWVATDGITLLEEHGLADVFAAEVERHPHRAEYGPDKGEYGRNRSRLMNHVRDMIGLAKSGMFNYVLTAHVMELHDPVNEREIWAPAFGSGNTQPPLGLKLAAMFNIVAYMQAKEKEGSDRQEVLTVDSDGFVGKDQYNCFPKLKSGRHGFVNPTMQDIEAAIAKVAAKPSGSRARKRPAKRTAKRTRRRKA